MADLQATPPPPKVLKALKEGPDRDAIEAAVPQIIAIKEDCNREFDLNTVSHVVVQWV